MATSFQMRSFQIPTAASKEAPGYVEADAPPRDLEAPRETLTNKLYTELIGRITDITEAAGILANMNIAISRALLRTSLTSNTSRVEKVILLHIILKGTV